MTETWTNIEITQDDAKMCKWAVGLYKVGCICQLV
jgi:hypothetical protein